MTGDGERRALLVVAARGQADRRATSPRWPASADWQIGGLTVERGRLDDVFRAITAPDGEPRSPWDFAKLSH